MDEAILLPSPNWFLISGLAVSTDGWLVYGGPSKSICILEPLAPDSSIIVREISYRSHFFGKVHSDKVTSIDVSPVWSEKKQFITGAADGTVKVWTLETVDNTMNLKYTYNHTMHSNEREDVVGVGYSSKNFAVTVGSYGRIVKWDLQSNLVKTYNLILAKFKPTCMACSPHICLQIAVGTKQGVILVVDLSDVGTTLFKVRSNDDEVLCVSWCPKYTVPMKKLVKVSEKKGSANKRMEKIRQEANKQQSDQLDDSALTKTLPDDSFDDTVVEEENLFDIYKDYEDEVFGHKKYIPEVVVVKEQSPIPTEFDYLTECLNLKDKILKSKEGPEPSIASLVDALDKTHVDDNGTTSSKADLKNKKKEGEAPKLVECNKQSQKHLLATIGKHGHLRIWSKNGKLLGNCVVHNKPLIPTKNLCHKVNQPLWGTLLWYKPDVLLITDARGQLLQCNPLVTDCRNRLELRLIDAIHKRGTFCMVSNAPRVQNSYVGQDSKQVENDNQAQVNCEPQENKQPQDKKYNNDFPEDKWLVWTAAQDRSLVCYSMSKRTKVATYNSCGGFVYNIRTCPYNAKRIALCVGDGAIRVFEADISDNDDSKLALSHVTSFWQNVQGKVLIAVWHPTKENIIAFGTAESRVGILDTSGHNVEKPARVLNIGVTGSVYSMCWGDRNDLYVCGGGDIFVCYFKKEKELKTISVELEGEKWRVTVVSWYPAGIMCGSFNGGVALLSNTTYEVLAVNFLFKKLINTIEWHPQFTSNSNDESAFKNLVAVCSMDKSYKIVILKHNQNEDGKHQLETYTCLEGHLGNVLQLAWSPHNEGQLASTSTDCTARIWDISTGTCTAIFPGHTNNPISIAWSAFPQLSNILFTGGGDYCVRLWKLDDYPPELFNESSVPVPNPKKEKKKRLLAVRLDKDDEVIDRPPEEAIDAESLYGESQEAEQMTIKLKAFKRFLLPVCSKQISVCTPLVVLKFAQKCMAKQGDDSGDEDLSMLYDTDFLKMFGTTNELNELLDYEMQCHLEAKDTDAWIVMAIFRGQIDRMIQFASKNDLLCPFLVSLSPCVSFKYWKDVTQLYMAQINRFIAQKKEHRLQHFRSYGGPVFRKVALLLSLHDVKGAVDCLVEAHMYRDAYILCRIRHMESIARETLCLWVKDTVSNGYLKMAILCYIALGELFKASTTSVTVSEKDGTWLSLATDLAKMAGQHTYAGHLEDTKELIKQAPNTEEVEDTLEELPTRIELFLRNNTSIKNNLMGGNDDDTNDLNRDDEGVENELSHEKIDIGYLKNENSIYNSKEEASIDNKIEDMETKGNET